jgi:hypothetical protein
MIQPSVQPLASVIEFRSADSGDGALADDVLGLLADLLIGMADGPAPELGPTMQRAPKPCQAGLDCDSKGWTSGHFIKPKA